MIDKKKNGFTLVELLATIVVLSIVVGITVVGVNAAFKNAKQKSEDVFVKTLEDALDIYIDTDAKDLSFGTSSVCTIKKTHGNVKLYRNSGSLTFEKVIGSSYSQLLASEVVNPAKKEVPCKTNGPLSIYKDQDGVYYYKITRSSFECLTSNNSDRKYITNLPNECKEK